MTHARTQRQRRESLDDYRHFRITAIDLLGRMPTRAEVAAFERADFDFDKWIDPHLSGPAYVERLTRVYMDLLRLEPNLNFSPGPAQLFRHEVTVADGTEVFVYYRNQQRRVPEPRSTASSACRRTRSASFVRPNMADAKGATPKAIPKKLLDERTVLVHPWWLYRDYKAAAPKERYLEGWKDAPTRNTSRSRACSNEPDGKPTESVRVCKEEAATAALRPCLPLRSDESRRGQKYAGRATQAAAGRQALCDSAQERADRVRFARALENAVDCGCGVGLERCNPNDGNGEGNAFYFPNKMPLGPGFSLDMAKQRAERWFPYWWSREAVHFLDDLFSEDRDFRLILTGHQSFVNGPLAQFYRSIQRSSCCGPETSFGMIEEDAPLFDPKNVPAGS